jgi:mannosylglycerate hydrolase
MDKQLIVIPHAHWDREWFDTFEVLRFHLVALMDRLIETLEREQAIPCFLLDGQMILIEDYLEIRPEMRARLEKLAKAGRITLGPWYVQPDEFLVSGESLIMNLEIGLEEAAKMGDPLMEGYVPDTFGHIQQLPQILNGFGIRTFYTMRGFGGNLDETGTEFLWKAPDGSCVAVHYIAESYSNAGIIGPSPAETAISHGKTVTYRCLDELVARMKGYSRIPALLLLNGSDHTALQENIAENIASLAAFVPVKLGRLEDISRLLFEHGDDFPVLEGEFRFGRYLPVLKDVISTRMYLKQMNRETEEKIALAERLNALSVCFGGTDEDAFLKRAWKELLKNHAHDSICGCSIDAVHDEMRVRFRHSLDLANLVVEEKLTELALSVNADSGPGIPVFVLNPSPWERSGDTLVKIIPLLESPLGKRIFGFSVPERDFYPDEMLLLGDDGRPIPFEAVKEEVAVMDILLRRKVLYHDTLRFRAESVPPLGYRLYYAVPKKHEKENAAFSDAKRPDPPDAQKKAGKEPASASLDNGVFAVTLSSNGTVTIRHIPSGLYVTGINEFIDEGDGGDEYSFSPLLAPRNFSTAGLEWNITENEGNRLKADCLFFLPEKLTENRRERSATVLPCALSTTIELQDNIVKFKTTFHNRCKDHRLRVRFPTGVTAEESIAETAFGFIQRPLNPEPCAGWREATSGNYVQRRFVVLREHDRGFVLFNKGLPEYEAFPGGDLFLTLIRAVGWLSRDDLPRRPGQAGPEIPTDGAQCRGEHTFEYGVSLFSESLADIPLFRMAEEFHQPLCSTAIQTSRRVSSKPFCTRFLSIDNPRIVLSAFKNKGRCLLIRVYNPCGNEEPFTAETALPLDRIRRVSLDGKEQKVVNAAREGRGFSDILAPYTLATYYIDS